MLVTSNFLGRVPVFLTAQRCAGGSPTFEQIELIFSAEVTTLRCTVRSFGSVLQTAGTYPSKLHLWTFSRYVAVERDRPKLLASAVVCRRLQHSHMQSNSPGGST